MNAGFPSASPEADTTITDRVYLDFGLCPEAIRVNRTLGDKSALCLEPEPLGRLVIGLYGKAAPGTVALFLATLKAGAYEGSALTKILPGQFLSAGKQGSHRMGLVEAPAGLPPNPDILSASAFRLRHLRPGTVSLNLSGGSRGLAVPRLGLLSAPASAHQHWAPGFKHHPPPSIPPPPRLLCRERGRERLALCARLPQHELPHHDRTRAGAVPGRRKHCLRDSAGGPRRGSRDRGGADVLPQRQLPGLQRLCAGAGGRASKHDARQVGAPPQGGGHHGGRGCAARPVVEQPHASRGWRPGAGSGAFLFCPGPASGCARDVKHAGTAACTRTKRLGEPCRGKAVFFL